MNNQIYIGVHSFVVCIDRTSGKEIWRTKLKRSHVLSVVLSDEIVIAHSGGNLFGLRADTGEILWKNDLPGLGYGYCTIATSTSQSAVQTSVSAAALATAAG